MQSVEFFEGEHHVQGPRGRNEFCTLEELSEGQSG